MNIDYKAVWAKVVVFAKANAVGLAVGFVAGLIV